ncbi:RNA polymerase sigma factor [Streptomyces sp. NPDC002577]
MAAARKRRTGSGTRTRTRTAAGTATGCDRSHGARPHGANDTHFLCVTGQYRMCRSKYAYVFLWTAGVRLVSQNPDTLPPPSGSVREGDTAAPDTTRTGTGPADAFDALYAFGAPSLVRQAYLLSGRRDLAREAVEWAFQQAWYRWPEVAVDPDPAGWVRAVAYEYAVSPWHRLRLRRSHRRPEEPPADPDDRRLLAAFLELPPSYRRTLLLYDGLGLDLPETAAETEASTPATANRLLHAREAIASQLPELSSPTELHRRLNKLADSEKLQTPKAEQVRTDSERRACLWTRAAIASTALIAAATALTLWTAPTHYEPPQAPGRPVTGVPPRMGPTPLTKAQKSLHDRLHTNPANGPQRLAPEPD